MTSPPPQIANGTNGHKGDPDGNLVCVLEAVETLRLQQRPKPSCGDNEVLVKVMSTGICGSDVFHYKNPNAPHGMVLGHESAGVIAEVGSKVTTRAVGQRVAIEPGFLCKNCEFCRGGHSNVCADIKYGGNDGTDGTMSQWFVCEPGMTVPMPEHISWVAAGCVQPLATAVQLARQAGLRAHQTVAVFGCGPLGLMTMALAKAYGASRVIAFDIESSRVDFARSFAADAGVVVTPPKALEDPFAAAQELVRKVMVDQGLQHGVDVAIEATGAEMCMQMCVCITKPHGTYLQAGFGKAMCTIPMVMMGAKSITMKGTVRYGPGTFEDAIDAIASGKVDVDRLVTGVFPLSNVHDAMQAQLRREGIKIVLLNQE